MGISWGALAGAFLGPMLWGLYSKRISKAAVWASFIVGVGLTTVNMIMGFVGAPLIASPINAGAIAMILSIVIVPVVSLFTKAVPFEVNPPSPESGTDRELYAELEAMPDAKASTRREIVAGANVEEIELLDQEQGEEKRE